MKKEKEEERLAIGLAYFSTKRVAVPLVQEKTIIDSSEAQRRENSDLLCFVVVVDTAWVVT